MNTFFEGQIRGFSLLFILPADVVENIKMADDFFPAIENRVPWIVYVRRLASGPIEFNYRKVFSIA
jgi:hypothetical protein